MNDTKNSQVSGDKWSQTFLLRSGWWPRFCTWNSLSIFFFLGTKKLTPWKEFGRRVCFFHSGFLGKEIFLFKKPPWSCFHPSSVWIAKFLGNNHLNHLNQIRPIPIPFTHYLTTPPFLFLVFFFGGAPGLQPALFWIIAGKPVVIDFYANFWPACGPAASEMDKLSTENENVTFLLVNLKGISGRKSSSSTTWCCHVNF